MQLGDRLLDRVMPVLRIVERYAIGPLYFILSLAIMTVCLVFPFRFRTLFAYLIIIGRHPIDFLNAKARRITMPLQKLAMAVSYIVAFGCYAVVAKFASLIAKDGRGGEWKTCAKRDPKDMSFQS